MQRKLKKRASACAALISKNLRMGRGAEAQQSACWKSNVDATGGKTLGVSWYVFSIREQSSADGIREPGDI